MLYGRRRQGVSEERGYTGYSLLPERYVNETSISVALELRD
jgi:hypothetical protein